MGTDREKILTIESLVIGYRSGRMANALLPPLTSSAVRGELIALIGENGIGKSTLLRTITGLQDPLSGSVIIDGRDIKEYGRHDLAKNVGYISTEQIRISNMTVYDLVALGRYPYTNWIGKLGNNDHELVAHAIEKAGLQDLAGRYINELSDGERQKAMIARVLAQDTEILVMDEPTAFLDVRSKYELIHLLHDLSRNRGKTIIFSTHDLLTAISESDKIWLTLRDSFIEGAPEDLILNGSFTKLFDASSIEFIPSDASFTFRKEMKGKVFVDGEGIDRYWTEKAANRAGFEISGDHSALRIKISVDDEEKRWYLNTGTSVVEFDSVYRLVKWLNENS